MTYARKPPQQTRPNRRAGNFYRTAEGSEPTFGGVPLGNVDAAVVAAVRMGYKVAEAQIDRSARLAKRLRDAGDQAIGPGSDRQALDAAERLVFRTMMSSLGWLEGVAAADRGSPIKRLIEAEYKLVGAMLGLTPADAAPGAPAAATEHSPERASEARSSPTPRLPALQIRFDCPEDERRPIRVAHWEIVAGASFPAPVPVKFFSDAKPESDLLTAVFTVSDKGAAMLSIQTKRRTPTGTWRSAICDADGLQLGLIELTL